MKRKSLFVILSIVIFGFIILQRPQANFACAASNTVNSIKTNAKAAYSMEFDTETPLLAENENERLAIASMCKIMTLSICLDEIENGRISMRDKVVVSENAAGMGGSQVFLEANASYEVKELLKSISVCSANDSCVAMAEYIYGSEEEFTNKMNEKAKMLGLSNTLFANCTGLPREPQYSCAKDVAIMLKNLLKHNAYYEFGKIWMDKFNHPEGRYTEISNTNKLIRFYEGCDGGKTGFTNQAGFCLAATAMRNGMRIISVVIGEKDSKTRFNDIKSTFDYAFANYTMKTVIDANNPLEEKVAVSGGTIKEISVKPERSSRIFSKKNDNISFTSEIIPYKNVKAPIKFGDRVGELIIYHNGVEKEKLPLLANETVERATLFDNFKEIAKNWSFK